MYDDKNKVNSLYFKKKNKKNKINLYKLLILLSILTFIFFVFLNNIKNFSKIKHKNFIKNNKSNDLLPPKPKEKWKYIHKLEDL